MDQSTMNVENILKWMISENHDIRNYLSDILKLFLCNQKLIENNIKKSIRRKFRRIPKTQMMKKNFYSLTQVVAHLLC